MTFEFNLKLKLKLKLNLNFNFQIAKTYNFQVSTFTIEPSNFKLQHSNFQLPTSNFKIQTPSLKHQTSNFKIQIVKLSNHQLPTFKFSDCQLVKLPKSQITNFTETCLKYEFDSNRKICRETDLNAF